MSLQAKLAASPTKKLLALDGGGIRGLIAIEVLAEIERALRQASGNPHLVLADYFDYIAGTSNGAVVGTLISLGKPVDEIRRIYVDFGKLMFNRGPMLTRFETLYQLKKSAQMVLNFILRSGYAEYSGEPLSDKLREDAIIGDDGVTLGSDRLRTLLLLIMSNASTNSPWPISNNPRAKYNDRARPDCNLDIPLWKLVRASAAAPTIFPAQQITLGGADKRKSFVFVDGGVTPYNNPSFQLFLQATLEPYGLRWRTGEQAMLLVSVGTGLDPSEPDISRPEDLDLVKTLQTVIEAQFAAALYQQDLLCRAFGRCRVGDRLDSEVEDMIGRKGPAEPKLFSYARYNITLERRTFEELGLGHIDPRRVRTPDSVQYIDELCEIGRTLAKKRVRPEHFDGFPPAEPLVD